MTFDLFAAGAEAAAIETGESVSAVRTRLVYGTPSPSGPLFEQTTYDSTADPQRKGLESVSTTTTCPPCTKPVDPADNESVVRDGIAYHGDCHDTEFNVAYCGECGTTHENPGSCVQS